MGDPDQGAWLESAWWYDPNVKEDLETQALHYATGGHSRHVLLWRCPKLRDGLASADGYLPGVRWSPPDFCSYLHWSAAHSHPTPRPTQPYPLSVNRFLAALRQAYADQDLEIRYQLAIALGLREPRKESQVEDGKKARSP